MLVIVGSYADAAAPGVSAFAFDAASGLLQPQGTFAGIANPSFLLLHPNGRWLYTGSETSAAAGESPGTVWACRLSAKPWALTPLGSQQSGGDLPCHLALDQAGRWLLVANYGTGSVAVLPVLPDGSLGPASDIAQHQGSGPDAGRQEGPHAHSATWSPDERFVIAADLGIDALLVYRFDAAHGTLAPRHRVATRPGAGPRHMAFRPDGQQLYVANELDSTISAYAYDAATGALHETQTLSTLLPGAPANTVADLHLDAAGRHAYVSNRGDDSLAAFAIDRGGRLSLLAVRPCGGTTPRNFALVPGKRWAIVANQKSDSLSVLPLGSSGAVIGEPHSAVAVARPACVQLLD